MARFLESRGMVAEALEVATDPDYRFELAIQLGKLEAAKVYGTGYTLLNTIIQDYSLCMFCAGDSYRTSM